VSPTTRITRVRVTSDQAQIEQLYARTPRAGEVAAPPANLPPDLKNIDQYFARFWVVVEPMDDAEVVVAMAGVQDVGLDAIDPPLAPFIDANRVVRLHRVTVAPERWRSGIGRGLVGVALEWARRNNFRSMVLETTPQQEAAVAMYLAAGFSEIGRTKFGLWELIWFEQRLSRSTASP